MTVGSVAVSSDCPAVMLDWSSLVMSLTLVFSVGVALGGSPSTGGLSSAWRSSAVRVSLSPAAASVGVLVPVLSAPSLTESPAVLPASAADSWDFTCARSRFMEETDCPVSCCTVPICESWVSFRFASSGSQIPLARFCCLIASARCTKG